MREIKFRGKIKQGEWVEGSYVYAYKWFGTGEASHFITSLYGSDRVLVMPETVGQYTGLKDKNGVEIFENDILKISRFEDGEFKIGKVYYKDGSFKLSEAYSTDGYNDLCNLFSELQDIEGRFVEDCICEVIGNIHDNPELLKE